MSPAAMDETRRLAFRALSRRARPVARAGTAERGRPPGQPRRDGRGGGALPDRVLEGVHQLPGSVRRVGQRLAPRRRRPVDDGSGKATRSSAMPSPSVPTIAADKGLSTTLGYTSAHASPVDFGPARATTPTCGSSVPLGIRADRRRRAVRRRVTASSAAASTGSSTVCWRTGSPRIRTCTPSSAPPGGRRWAIPSRPHTCWASCCVRRRGQRVVGHRCPLLRVAPGPDPGVPRVPDQRAVPGAVRLPRSPTRSSARCSGLNAPRLYDVDPITVPCTFTREELEQIRLTIPADTAALGPRQPIGDAAVTSRTNGRRSATSPRRRCGSCRRARRG